jgi:hypothetical protein
VLFDRVLKPGKPMTYGYAWSDRLRGSCPDVLVEGHGKSEEYAAVLSARGVPRWSLVHKRNDLRPGTVVRPKTAPPASCR